MRISCLCLSLSLSLPLALALSLSPSPSLSPSATHAGTDEINVDEINIGDQAMVVDIGGGTTDVTLNLAGARQLKAVRWRECVTRRYAGILRALSHMNTSSRGAGPKSAIVWRNQALQVHGHHTLWKQTQPAVRCPEI